MDIKRRFASEEEERCTLQEELLQCPAYVTAYEDAETIWNLISTN